MQLNILPLVFASLTLSTKPPKRQASEQGTSFDICTIPKVVPRAFQRSCNEIILDSAYAPLVEEYHRPHPFPSHPSNFVSSWIVGGPRIWNYEPICLHDPKVGSSCVYTSSWFAKGRGLSLLTSPTEARLALQAPIFKNAAPNTDVLGDVYGDLRLAESRFERHKFPHKGVGLVATQSIQRGDMIYATTPLTMMSMRHIKGLEAHNKNLLMSIAVERLPRASRDLFLEMKGHFDSNPYADRVSTNSFQSAIGKANETYWNVYPEGARLNHDCRPNTAYNINPDTLVHSLNVLRAIHPGEEITTSYLPPYHTWIERRERTAGQWGFNCTCNLCSAPDHVIERSDDRLLLIVQLERELANLSFATQSRTTGPSHAEMLVSLYQMERLDGAIAEAYAFAALEYAYIGDKGMTQKYAALAVEALQLWRGVSRVSHSAIKRFEELLVSPEKQHVWNYAEVVRKYVKANGSERLMQAEKTTPLQQFGSIFLGFGPTNRDVSGSAA